jgi:hypothetical protein
MNQSNWRNTDDYVIKTEGGYSLNIVDLFIRIHILTGKFPTFTKEEAKELKALLQKLDESMNVNGLNVIGQVTNSTKKSTIVTLLSAII